MVDTNSTNVHEFSLDRRTWEHLISGGAHKHPQCLAATDRGCGGAQPQRIRICVEVRIARPDAIAAIICCGWAPPQPRSVHYEKVLD
jgi:hypothetical protein